MKPHRWLLPLAACAGTVLVPDFAHAQFRGRTGPGYVSPYMGSRAYANGPGFLRTPGFVRGPGFVPPIGPGFYPPVGPGFYPPIGGFFPSYFVYPIYGNTMSFNTAPQQPTATPLNWNFPERPIDSPFMPAPVVSPPSDTARLVVDVPVADAEVSLNGQKMDGSGTTRSFVTPKLEPGKNYEYDVTAKWTVDGRAFERKQTITIKAGAEPRVVFRE
jgi:uncharacterized protein (TIGR03000 family)